MLQWFITGLIVTVFWGNGAVEEGRTEWGYVFYGTSEQCQTFASDILLNEQKAAANLSQTLRDRSTSHAYMPQRFNGGIVSRRPVSAFCAPFTTPADIERAFPVGHGGFSGARLRQDGTQEWFRWWDGPDGAAFDKK
jgi:hypothetical protein